jgi:hypothetical protein
VEGIRTPMKKRDGKIKEKKDDNEKNNSENKWTKGEQK